MRGIFLQCFILLILLNFAHRTELQGRDSNTTSKEESFLPLLSDTILNLDDTLRFDLANCAFTAEVCIGVPIGEISNFQITTNGSAYTNGIAGCDFDTSNFYSYTNLFGQGNLGPYILQSWDVNGSIFSAPFNSINELVDSMNVWDPTGNWIHESGSQIISGGTPGYTYSDLVIWVVTISTQNIIDHNDTYIPQGTLLFMNSGATELIITESSTGDTDTAFIIASCAQPNTITEDVFLGFSETYCLDLSELPGDFMDATNICPPGEVDFQFINADSCLQITGINVGTDTACIVACDVLGVCDTTYLIVNVLPVVGSHELFDTVFSGNSGQWCVDPTIFVGTPDTIYNICPGNSGTYAAFTIDENSYCVDYTGLTHGGTDQGCFVVCDEFNNCDTTFIDVTVRRAGPAYYFDTLYLNESNFFCDWDLSNLDGSIVNIENGCPGSSGTEVFFDLDLTNFCIDYDALSVGKDSACIYLTDDTGFVDTTIAVVCVIAPTPVIVIDNIRLSNTPVYCVDTTQLAGDIVSIENICPDASGESIDFVLDSLTFCLQAFPIQVGIDSACIVICDDFGVCDTTTYIITVDEDVIGGRPEAFDDIDSTAQNTSVIIDACFNDSVPQSLPVTNFFVLPVASGGIGPSNGTAFSNLDCTVSYVPNDDYCGDDQISYVICNQMGCDTATITITVTCPSSDFKVFNAFSPNGDGVNETFRINGLENFPDHVLYVYNRWGNQVLKVENYQNDWNGTWQGLDLPDGTYFYLFDGGDGTSESGYVYIGR